MFDRKKIEINYLFYGIIFLFILFTSITNIFSIESLKVDYRSFFILHCLGQALLEVSLLILIGYLIELFLPMLIFNIYIGFCFVFFLTHLIDFVLIRLMDLSFWTALSVALDETFANFIEMLILSGIPLVGWCFLALTALFLPFLGIFLYKISKKISQKKPFHLKNEYLLQGCFCLILSLFFWDFSASPTIHPDIYQTYQKSLPWKTTFLTNKNKIITIEQALKKPAICKKNLIIDKPSVLTEKPNIYLFICESLRADFITEEITPGLHDFKKENISFDLSLANSNNTHCSWFSIFYSKYPFYWTSLKKKNLKGSPALNILKEAGYKIHVLSSSGLHYYNMDELLFGKNKKLLDSFYVNTKEPYKSDKIVFQKALDLSQTKGNIFVVFLESTHFHYSWPPDIQKKFSPVTGALVTLPIQKHITAIKNRYKNALNYLDTLFTDFTKNLKQKNSYDDSIIIVTGDHGEEFFEKGHLFHASHLSHVQTHIPIYYKFPQNTLSPNLKITSQIDIFPTILDYLFKGDKKYNSLFDGRSIFDEKRNSFVISTRYNGSRTPDEFFLHNGKNKVILKFQDKDIFKSKNFKILSIRDLQDEIKLLNSTQEKELLKQLKEELESAFSS